MKYLLTLLACAAMMRVQAQAPSTLPPAPTEEMQSPGVLIEEGARLKNAGIVVTLVWSGIGTMVALRRKDDSAVTGAAIGGIGAIMGLSLAIHGNTKHVKAGRLLRERGY